MWLGYAPFFFFSPRPLVFVAALELAFGILLVPRALETLGEDLGYALDLEGVS